MKRKTKEWLVSAGRADLARSRLKTLIEIYTDQKKWKFLVEPEVQKYEGRSKKLQGKWRAYARIEWQ